MIVRVVLLMLMLAACAPKPPPPLPVPIVEPIPLPMPVRHHVKREALPVPPIPPAAAPVPVAEHSPPVTPPDVAAAEQDVSRAQSFLHDYRERLPCAGPDSGPALLCKDPATEHKIERALDDAGPAVERAKIAPTDSDASASAKVAVQPLKAIVDPLAQ